MLVILGRTTIALKQYTSIVFYMNIKCLAFVHFFKEF